MSGDKVELGIEDGGRTAAVSAGAEVVLRLPENAGTGFRWCVPSGDGIELVGDVNEANGDAPGASGTRVFRLRVTAPASLKLERAQAWEPDQAPDARFEIDLQTE